MQLLSMIWAIGLMSSVFANGLGDQASIPDRVKSKTQKMVLDSALLNTQYYKVRIKGKVEQSRERSGALPLHFSVVAFQKEAFRAPSTKGRQLYLLTYQWSPTFYFLCNKICKMFNSRVFINWDTELVSALL